MTIRFRHIIAVWILVMLLVTMVPYGHRTTHPNTAFAGFPLETMNWQEGRLKKVSVSGLAWNTCIWTTPFAFVGVLLSLARRSG